MWAWRKPCPHCFLSSTLRHSSIIFQSLMVIEPFLIFTCTITIFALTSATTCAAVSIITINAFSTHSSDTCSCASCTFTP